MQSTTLNLGKLCLIAAVAFGASAYAEETTLKDAAKEVGQTTGTAVREVGQGAKKASKEVGHTVKKAAKETGHAFRDGAKEFKKAVKGDSAKSDKPKSAKNDVKNDKDAKK